MVQLTLGEDECVFDKAYSKNCASHGVLVTSSFLTAPNTTAPNTCFDKEREAETHGHPIGAFQILSKTAEILSASVALPLLLEIVMVT